MIRAFIPRLHLLTDTAVQQQHSHAALAAMAWAGGAGAVQFRFKGDVAAAATQLDEILKQPRLPHQRLIVNDHVALAQQAGVDGVHLGQGDMHPRQARELLGPGAIIGATVHSHAELEALLDVASSHIDYIGVGPVFGTQSKQTGLPALGLQGLEQLVNHSPWPVIAIGNVTLQNAASVFAAGAHGIAVLSAFCCDPDPKSIATRFARILPPL